MSLVVPSYIVAITFVLTLAFRMSLESITGVKLSIPATTMVAGLWFAVILGTRWLWARRKKKSEEPVAAKAAAGGKP